MIPPHERRILEAFILRIPISQLELSEVEMDEYQKNDLKNLIKLRVKGIPLQYLIGEQAFYGRNFYVNTNVLIPRPETEGLVELLLGCLPKTSDSLRGLELGTGSGCIALTVAMELPNAFISATDSSDDALEVARENQKRFSVRNVEYLKVTNPPQMNEYKDLQAFDFIVSNPPYLDKADEISEEVLSHEPSEALFPLNDDPLCHYKFLCDLVHFKLNKTGTAIFEIASERANDVMTLFSDSGLDAKLFPDLTQRDRYVLVKHK